jgi:hypothetical protein
VKYLQDKTIKAGSRGLTFLELAFFWLKMDNKQPGGNAKQDTECNGRVRLVCKQKIKEIFLVSPFLVFFLVHSEQIGVGVLGYQRIIAKYAGYDSWIAVIIAAFFVHILIWMIYYVLDNGEEISLLFIKHYLAGC